MKRHWPKIIKLKKTLWSQKLKNWKKHWEAEYNCLLEWLSSQPSSDKGWNWINLFSKIYCENHLIRREKTLKPFCFLFGHLEKFILPQNYKNYKSLLYILSKLQKFQKINNFKKFKKSKNYNITKITQVDFSFMWTKRAFLTCNHLE
jgi:hypothetical protein